MEIVASTSTPKKTEKAFLWTQLLGNPFFSILEIFVFILLKQLKASGFQFALVLALKPACSLLSPYWSAIIHKRQDLVKVNLIFANLIRYFPFLFFPFYQSIWLFIGSMAIYWMMTKGMNPAWMECIKVTLPKGEQERICARGLKVNYWGNILFPIVVGFLLDCHPSIWEWIFPIAALVGMGSTFLIHRLPELSQDTKSVQCEKKSLRHMMTRPWKDVFTLLRSHSSFLQFQIAFFIGGAGLMILCPTAKRFLTELDLSYLTISVISMTIKGSGFILASPIWVKNFGRVHILKLSQLVLLFAFAFPLILMLGNIHLLFIYLAYFLYGVMQGGSELTWRMSGVLYSEKKPSSVYTSTNLFASGVRGLVFPFLAAYLLGITSISTVFIMGGGMILMGIGFISLSLFRERGIEKEKWGKISEKSSN